MEETETVTNYLKSTNLWFANDCDYDTRTQGTLLPGSWKSDANRHNYILFSGANWQL